MTLATLISDIRAGLRPPARSPRLGFLPGSRLFTALRPLLREDAGADTWPVGNVTPTGRAARLPRAALRRPLFLAFGAIVRSQTPFRVAPLLTAPVRYDSATRAIARLGPNAPNRALLRALAANGDETTIHADEPHRNSKHHDFLDNLFVGPFIDDYDVVCDALDAELHPEILTAPAARLLAGDRPLDLSPVSNAPEADESAEGAARESRLDPDQTAVVAAALAGRDFIVEGPPGCGKSHAIAAISAAFARSGRRVLVSASICEALAVARRRISEHQLSEPQFKRVDILSLGEAERAGRYDYDLLLVDEASRMRLDEAIRLATRAKQVILIGDNAQIRPFGGNPTPLAQSVLGALATRLPSRILRYHYRSWTPELIGPSNLLCYNSRLRCLPPPERQFGDGLRLAYLPLARLNETPKGPTNPIEAEAVAKALVERAASGSAAEIAALALTRAQANLIEKRASALARANPRLRRSVPFQILTPREAQGQEFDHVLISLVAGRLADGALPRSFPFLDDPRDPPIPRLNVAMSRARTSCTVFSSLTPQAPFGLTATRAMSRDCVALLGLLGSIAARQAPLYTRDTVTPEIRELAVRLCEHEKPVIIRLGAVYAVARPNDRPNVWRAGILVAMPEWTDADRLAIPAMLRLKGWNIVEMEP